MTAAPAAVLQVDPGDLCLDPHVGGGTTLVEALAAGRNAIGVNISALAEFVATVKSTIYSEAELDKLESWSARVSMGIDIHKASNKLADYAELGYYKLSMCSITVGRSTAARTVVVQMLAFAERDWQLPRYLETMEEAGLQEVFLPMLKEKRDGRLWRTVPGRRWYSDQRGAIPGSQEVVLTGMRCCLQCPLWVMSGHLQCTCHVRFNPESGHVHCTRPCRFGPEADIGSAPVG